MRLFWRMALTLAYICRVDSEDCIFLDKADQIDWCQAEWAKNQNRAENEQSRCAKEIENWISSRKSFWAEQ